MNRSRFLAVSALALTGLLPVRGADGDIVFRSDVSMVRVDAQVVDQSNRAITGLQARDFVLLEDGKPQQIRNFLSEDMPIDVLFLLDVSRSMRPHVERIADASHEALRVLRDQDRMAIMVFDRSTHVRLTFRSSRSEVEQGFQSLLRHESFNGGTDITRGLLDAAEYIGREGRPDVRRAIVILTDDQTEMRRDEAAVNRALTKANAVLFALLAPDAMRYGGGGQYPGPQPQDGPYPGGGYPGGGYPRGPMGGPLGGIIFGRRGPYGYPGGGYPGGGYPGGGRRGGVYGPHTQSAGTAEIARQSGGDSMSVNDASSLETTLARLRQRYTLHFYLPQGVKPGEERAIEVELASAARERYPEAEVRYRRVYYAPGGPSGTMVATAGPRQVSRASGGGSGANADSIPADDQAPTLKRRRAVDGPAGSGPILMPDSTASPGAQPQAAPAPSTDQGGGWRRVKPGEQP